MSSVIDSLWQPGFRVGTEETHRFKPNGSTAPTESRVRATATTGVVGPNCETGDIPGLDRLLPESNEGDVILIANTGACGAAMASSYNLREPAEELVLSAR